MPTRKKQLPPLQRQQKHERRIFRAFANEVPHRINLRSIRSEKDPAPDISYRLSTGERVAFELAEILDKGYARNFHDTMILYAKLVEALENSPDLFRQTFEQMFSNAVKPPLIRRFGADQSLGRVIMIAIMML